MIGHYVFKDNKLGHLQSVIEIVRMINNEFTQG